MNKLIGYSAVFFVAGFCIGGAISWSINKRKYKKKYEWEAALNQHYYLELLGYSENKSDDEPDEISIEQDNDSDAGSFSRSCFNRPVDESDEHYEDGSSIKESLNTPVYEYTQIKNGEKTRKLKQVNYDKIYEEKVVDEESMAINNDQQDLDISIITSDQFAREHLGFEKETLLWWPDNNIMSTEDYDVIEAKDLIGTEWINRIGEFEPNTVYVRNMIAETDYEIIQQPDDYYDYK